MNSTIKSVPFNDWNLSLTGDRPEFEMLPEMYKNDKHHYKIASIIQSPKSLKSKCQCSVDLLILVKSAMSHKLERDIIRSEWTREDVAVGFILGVSPDISNATYGEETDENKDIITADFWDTYRNLTTKSLAGMKVDLSKI